MCVCTLSKTLFIQPHTILLIQPTRAHETRTYTDYESIEECLEGKYNHMILYN